MNHQNKNNDEEIEVSDSNIVSERDRFLNSWRLRFLTALAIAMGSIMHVLIVMGLWGVFSFAFDDSWIHVQYAKSIFEGNAWQYAYGIPSTGSSAPLWSVILAPIFIFGYSHDVVVISVLVIASFLYFVDIFLVGEIVYQHTENWGAAILGQIIFILVPRNAGLMLSGMETPLGMFFLLFALLILPRPEWKYDLLLGVVAGLAYLCRPEFVLIAATCLPVRMLGVLYKEKLNPKRLLSFLAMFAVAALIVLPWILHCLNTTGLPLPDSYYSKMRYGHDEEALAFWNFFWYKAWFPNEPYLIFGFIGGAMLTIIKRRPYELILATSFFLLYQMTMPATSLLFDARYLVPLFDILSIAFVSGLTIIIAKVFSIPSIKTYFTGKEKMIITLGIIFLLFAPSILLYFQHVEIHANQVKNIEEMQVTLSLWARENIPEGEVIATYDVGAIGYFAKSMVLDTYGLVTPIFLHEYPNSTAQVKYLEEIGCNYIMYYVQWFDYFRIPLYYQGATVQELYRAHLSDNVVCGSNDMAIYRIYWS